MNRTENSSIASRRKDRLSRQLSLVVEKNRGRTALPEHEVKDLLRETGLPVPRGMFIPKGKTIHARGMRYPLVAKVSSVGISSKSDVGGVALGLKDRKSLEEAVSRLMGIEGSEGVLVEEMAPEGVEVIIGGIIDMQFGPVVMFGLGGIFVELFRDVAFGMAPMNEADAMTLIKQVKGYRLLKGYRGRKPVDTKSLLKSIVVVSRLMATGLIEEMDLNPVSLYPDGAMILDAKLSLRNPA